MTGRNINDLISLAYKGETKSGIKWLNQAVEAGVDVKQMGIELVERLRELMLHKLEIISIEVSAKGRSSSGRKDDYVDVKRLRECLVKANRAVGEIKNSVIEVLPLELMMIDLGVEQVEEASGEIKTATKSETEKKVSVKTSVSAKPDKQMLSSVMNKWQAILESLRPQNHSLEALLRATKPTGFDGKYLVLEVFYKFHKERLEAERYRRLVEETASKILNQPINVRFYLGDKAEKVVASSPDDNITAKLEDDIIKTAEEVFGVEVN